MPDPRNAPTMRDVATRAGVGIKTVSRVVNDEYGVSAKTRGLVKQAIAELGFQPNAMARSLRQGSSATVGLILEDVSEPFQAIMTRSIEEAVLADGRMLFTASTATDENRERALFQAFLARQVDGIIAVPSSVDQSYLAAHLAAGLKVVFVDRPASGVDIDCVLSDNVGGARSGVEHLIRHGHRRIGFIGARGYLSTTEERFEGYSQALARHGIPLDDEFVAVGAMQNGNLEAALGRMLVPGGVTALFLGASLISLSALRMLEGTSQVPAIVAFDDLPMADLIRTPLTVVAQDPAGVGRAAAELLGRRLAGDDGPPQQVRIGTRLITRGSGERPPPSDSSTPL